MALHGSGIKIDRFAFERELASSGVQCIAGVDEAGRGPLAGPVVAAAVVFEKEPLGDGPQFHGLTDSKALTEKKREQFFEQLTTCPYAHTAYAIIEPDEASVSLFAEDDLAATASGAIFSSDLALVSSVSRQVELARTPLGAKKVAKSILLNEYGFSEKEYKCLNSLWTKESNWNYKARNKNSGAHGIPQALPATKMNVVSTDWRTNPVTQIRWGLRYISIRYETPCKALAKHKRSNWY